MKTYMFFLCMWLKISYGDKRSLTFVIDDTQSMFDDIDQVKRGTNLLFDAVVNSNASQVENFILVTFNDPTFRLRTITKNREEFKRSLASIVVNGGGDCPEMAMHGIQLALESSYPGSYLYVFSDATAKDHNILPKVQNFAVKQKSKIFVLLTDVHSCSISDNDPQYQAFHKLADATSGQVFHMEKTSIKKVLNYVAETIKNEKVILVSKKVPPGYGYNVSIPVDSEIKRILISESGKDPVLKVSDPDGDKPDVKDVVSLPGVKAVLVETPKTGNYSADFGSKSSTTLIVSGETDLNFKYGFSGVEPATIKDTASIPITGEKTYIAIELISPAKYFHVITVEIIDTDENIVDELPVTLIDSKLKLYVTKKLNTPKTRFKIAIKGENIENHKQFRRTSNTVIEPQRPELDKAVNKPLHMTIDKGLKVVAEYSKPLKLSCKVIGYPKPEIIWMHENGSTLSTLVTTVELPYVYVNVLNIDNVKTNSSYSCKAKNDISEVAEKTYIETKIPYYFNIIKKPQDIVIKYRSTANIHCIVNAEPPAKIKWYGNGIELTNGDFFEVSSDNSLLIVKDMRGHMEGIYYCEAMNMHNRKLFRFQINISGFEKPRIMKTDPEIHTVNGRDEIISCKLVKGIPTPTFDWYFKPAGSDNFEKMEQTDDVIYLTKVNSDNSGEYKCRASNDAGTDFRITTLEVGYAPTIKPGPAVVTSTQVERTGLSCDTQGTPRPKVKWYHNNVKIFNDRNFHITRDMSVRFSGTKENSGNFTCVASNIYGSANKTVRVDYLVPVTLKAPKSTHLKKRVGDTIKLSCLANGYPEATIKWLFFPSGVGGSHKDKVEMSPNGNFGSLILRRLQLNQDGYYMCKADNLYSSANLTYYVEVFAPPYIEKNLKNTYSTVLGDILQIPCKAYGNPKPSITWTKDDYNIAAGTAWYEIVSDGTLIIKEVDEKSAGYYSCHATNHLGNATASYRVILGRPDNDNISNKTVHIEMGRDTELACDIKHSLYNKVRWFKDGKLLTNSVLRNVKLSDSGIYICRVNTLSKPSSAAIEVIVGYKPAFVSTDVDYEIDYIEDQTIWLDCNANGKPNPQVIWFHNKNQMKVAEMINLFKMNPSAIGPYTCIVKNIFGAITRDFYIIPQDCFLNIREDFTNNQPIMMEYQYSLSTFETSKGYIQIPTGTSIGLHCPSGFENIPQNNIFAICEKGKLFNIEGRNYEYSELNCVEEVTPIIKWTGKKCQSSSSEVVQVGFEFNEEFATLYEVCWDKEKNMPIYTKHTINRFIADIEPKNPKWFDDKLTKKFEDFYNCDKQIKIISRQLNKPFHETDKCCFIRRLLISPRDLPGGIAQKSAYVNVNAAPQWSSCDTENWAHVEQKVRNLAKSSYDDFIVWTGTSGSLKLKNNEGINKKVLIKNDDSAVAQDIPRYLWKVVQNPDTKSSIAIVQVNVPDVTILEAYKLMPCPDICNEIEWMSGVHWRNPAKGYTFCCSLDQFEKKFNLRGYFGDNKRNLTQWDWLPKHTLTLT